MSVTVSPTPSASLSVSSVVPALRARGLSAARDDGSVLYDDLSLVLHDGPSALVGANGVGKSTLLRQLAEGARAGTIELAGDLCLLTQHPGPLPARVVDLLGLGARFDALQRLLAGDGDAADAACVDDDWTLDARLHAAFEALGFQDLAPTSDPSRLSGGQVQQLRLLAASWRDARVLLLDEPSTFLDGDVSTHWCRHFLQRAGVTMVVTHDPVWLRVMPRLVELRPDGLHWIEGGLDAWRATRETVRRQTEGALAQARTDRARAQRAVGRERQRLDQRQARGRRMREDSNQSPLLLDQAKGNAERHAGRARGALAQRLADGETAIRDAFAAIDATPAPAFVDAGVVLPGARRVLRFTGAHPLADAPVEALTWDAFGPVRIGLEGRNGSGKSTLLRALCGEAGLASGTVDACVPVQSLDQMLATLPEAMPALDWLAARMQADALDVPATRLALLGLAGARARQPLGLLSGGERMRVALAAAAWAQPAAPLLLLDEPASHLDLDSVDALVALLRGWPGALLVVSHDPALLDALALTHRLHLDTERLHLEAVDP
ncbi:ATP-binding cassette domain-containing protein [Luteimonas terrae]|uniref:ATPase subunit of ABC transporter with duplicated ATPase domains n=1 Tax=Luteimonas terrae TaxID=1530191 RepID=A0ABU1Y2P4_9GAMM|nr:ATP-binding cassette domain-containing protein [Luteimonas terrae]MDR7194720.1 ATPase subunit of ABC transporter with duplicated ATPase domains [Luteimonas terrae]